MKNQLGLMILALVVAAVTVGCSAVVKSDNLAPQMSYVSPKGVAAGSPSFTLNVVGSNLRPDSTVYFKGVARETRSISETQLAASILSTDVAQVGAVEVVVAAGEPLHGFIRSNVLSFDVTPASASVQITTNSLPGGSVGRSYSANVAVSGGIPAHRWNLSSGQLPPGLTLSTVNGAISGSPVQAGQFDFTVQVTDSSSPNPQTAAKRLSLNIGTDTLPLVVNTATLPAGGLQLPYAATLAAAGGIQPYSWSIVSGSLPPGLTLSASTGSIAGAPLHAGGYSFTVQVRDSANPAQRATKALVLTVAGTQLQITTTSLPGGVVGVGYSTTLGAANGTPPYVWNISSGQLPTGLVLQASTGVISGTPAQSGAFTFLVTVRDSSGQTASGGFGVNVAPVSAPSISGVSPNSGSISGGTPVTVTGANFQFGAAVMFGGVPAAATVSSASQIQVVTPAHAAGTVDITVRNPDGQSSTLSGGFMYNQLPLAISAVSPNNGFASGGIWVSIRGTNFLAGARVLFGNVSAPTVNVNSSTEIQALTPAHSVGVVDVAVQNPDGQSATLGGGFSYEESSIGDVLFSNGFESGDFSKWDYAGGFNCTPPCGVSINSDRAFVHSGNYSAKFFYNLPANFGEDHQDDNEKVEKVFNPPLQDFWARGYVYMKSPEPGGERRIDSGRKLIGYGSPNFINAGWSGYVTTTSSADESEVFRPRVQFHAFDTHGQLVVDTSYYCSRTFGWDSWHSVELHIRGNTPGQSDGATDLWLDGVSCLGPESQNINNRAGNPEGLKTIVFGMQSDRANRRVVKEYRFWDDIVISTSGYIGP